MPEQNKTLTGKVALVTGSSRGIGAAIALKLASHGADVVINYVASEQAANAVAAKARDDHGVRAISVQADVSQDADVARLFQMAKKELGRVDIVMSNSGIEHFGALDKVTGAEIDKVFAVNVKAQYYVAQEAHKVIENGGRLILMSSVSAVMGIPRHAIYAASKAAITGMVKCLAWDFGPKQVTVNVIAPGGVKTDMYAQVAGEYLPGAENWPEEKIDKTISAWSPLGRVGMPDDVAGLVALLASSEAGWITGQTLHVSGGAHMATS